MNLVKTLMERDGLTREDAEAIAEEMKESIYNGDDPDDVLYEHGLESDYIDDLF